MVKILQSKVESFHCGVFSAFYNFLGYNSVVSILYGQRIAICSAVKDLHFGYMDTCNQDQIFIDSLPFAGLSSSHWWITINCKFHTGILHVHTHHNKPESFRVIRIRTPLNVWHYIFCNLIVLFRPI